MWLSIQRLQIGFAPVALALIIAAHMAPQSSAPEL
jgi:hypothetical protein